jgi:hypothetical protein
MLPFLYRGERIRTSDLSVPNRALYQAEPRPAKKNSHCKQPTRIGQNYFLKSFYGLPFIWRFVLFRSKAEAQQLPIMNSATGKS